jgi:hypothetical protein
MLKVEHDCCELTGETERLHLHHVHLRSQGGDDVRGNIVCMSEDQHTRWHRGDEAVRSALAWYVRDKRPDVVAYFDAHVAGGFDLWFEKHTNQLTLLKEDE